MSCLEVLYQPYAAHPYQGKHSIYQTEKSPYSPKRNCSTSSEREFVGGKMSFKSPSSFGENHENSPVFFPPPTTNYSSTSKKTDTKESCLFATDQTQVSSCRYESQSDATHPPRTSCYDDASSSSILTSSGEKLLTFGNRSHPDGGSISSSSSSSVSTEADLAKRLSPTSELSSCRLQCRKTPSARRVSARCVMFTYFDGNTSDEVDGHFTRALSDESSSSKEGASPMIKRNFPPSFWNSEYRRPPSNRRFPIAFNAGGALSSLIPGSRPHPNPFSHTTNPAFLALDRLAPNFDPYSSSCNFTGFQNPLQHAGIGDPWNAYASISGHSSYTHRALNAVAGVSDLYGLSAAAVAAAASHSLDQRYNSLLLQPSASLRAGATLAAGLSAARSSGVGKDAHLWPVTRYSGFRF